MAKHYEYISKKNKNVRRVKDELINILRDVQDEIRNQFTFQYQLVGSYSRNMITYDPKSNVGFDLDVNIFPNDEENVFTAKRIKNILFKAIQKYAVKYGYEIFEDSKRVITIKVVDKKNSKIIHSVDFAIVHNYGDNLEFQEYIHFDKKSNAYIWEKQGDVFYDLPKRIEWLKNEELWQKVREMYLNLKNNNQDKNKKSRSLFAEAVKNICNKYGYFD